MLQITCVVNTPFMIISGPTPNGFRASLHIITDIQVTGMMPVDDLEAQLDFRAHNGHELLLHGFVEFEEHSMYLMMKKAGHNCHSMHGI